MHYDDVVWLFANTSTTNYRPARHACMVGVRDGRILELSAATGPLRDAIAENLSRRAPWAKSDYSVRLTGEFQFGESRDGWIAEVDAIRASYPEGSYDITPIPGPAEPTSPLPFRLPGAMTVIGVLAAAAILALTGWYLTRL
jgi:hypothetical protein